MNHHSITTLTACMYGIFTYISDKNQPNVGKYTIHDGMGYDSKIMKLVPIIKITNRKSKLLKLLTAPIGSMQSIIHKFEPIDLWHCSIFYLHLVVFVQINDAFVPNGS